MLPAGNTHHMQLARSRGLAMRQDLHNAAPNCTGREGRAGGGGAAGGGEGAAEGGGGEERGRGGGGRGGERPCTFLHMGGSLPYVVQHPFKSGQFRRATQILPRRLHGLSYTGSSETKVLRLSRALDFMSWRWRLIG